MEENQYITILELSFIVMAMADFGSEMTPDTINSLTEIVNKAEEKGHSVEDVINHLISRYKKDIQVCK